MFLIYDTERSCHVFTQADPRDDGSIGSVQTDVTFEDDGDNDWPDGAPCPERVLGVSISEPKKYKIFKYSKDCKNAGFRILGTHFDSDYVSYAAYFCHWNKATVTVGQLRGWLHGFWDQHGDRLIRDGGFAGVTPSLKRRLMRTYIDGEPPTNRNVLRLWRPLKDDEKLFHLLDAFPDDE